MSQNSNSTNLVSLAEEINKGLLLYRNSKGSLHKRERKKIRASINAKITTFNNIVKHKHFKHV